MIGLIQESMKKLHPFFSLRTLSKHLTHFDIDEFECDNYKREVNTLLDSPNSNFPSWTIKYEPSPDLAKEPMLPSIQSPPQLELKPLPSTLKYVFLEPKDTLPVIIVVCLTPDQESELLLKKHKDVIGWSVADLKGISPSNCTHCIYCEDNTKPFRKMQRRLNTNMREVVKKVVKWLDAGIIYPISDSQWVSPTQVVPKKSGLTIVRNDQGELIPTRTHGMTSLY